MTNQIDRVGIQKEKEEKLKELKPSMILPSFRRC